MASSHLPLELLLKIADNMTDDRRKLRYRDFNSFLQINCALHDRLNNKLWKEAADLESEASTLREHVLTHLINNNNLERLKFFLELGADKFIEVRLPAFKIEGVNSRGYGSYETPLLLAADLDNVLLARLLLEKGAQVQYSDESGGKFSPMHAARSADMVQLLLDHGADPNLADETQRRPLHWFASGNEITAMQAILQHGADVHAMGGFGMPIHEAASSSLAAVELLLAHGADAEARDHQFNTPLHEAARYGKTDVMTFLLERWPQGTRKTNIFQETPLHFAIGYGWEKTNAVRLLLEQWPAGARECDSNSNTPLHVAAAGGDRNIDLVKLLVELWPEGMRVRGAFGATPLHLAATAWGLEVVRFLVQRWPDGKQALNDGGDTPWSLFEACTSHSQQVTEKEAEILALLGGADSEVNNG
jgi:ankyrin repeat protein